MEIPWEIIEKIGQWGIPPALLVVIMLLHHQIKSLKEEVKETKNELLKYSDEKFDGMYKRQDYTNGRINKLDNITLEHHGKIGKLEGKLDK